MLFGRIGKCRIRWLLERRRDGVEKRKEADNLFSSLLGRPKGVQAVANVWPLLNAILRKLVQFLAAGGDYDASSIREEAPQEG